MPGPHKRLTTAIVIAALLVVVVVAAAAIWWPKDTGPEQNAAPKIAATSPAPTRSPTPSSSPSAPTCASGARKAFVPTTISVDHVTDRSTVLAVPRDSAGTPGIPPLTSEGKQQFAWDAPGIKPGAPIGNVILDAHTWPDGSAIGNRLLDRFHEKDELILKGDHGQRLCYRVTDRIEVPANDAPADRVYDRTGKHQVVIIVCSGNRRGPEDWTHRTLWFASPVR